MKASSPASSPIYRKRLVDELIQGREFTNQLRTLSFEVVGNQNSTLTAPTHDLIDKIQNAFEKSLEILNPDDFDEDSQVLAANSPCYDSRRSEDSGESHKMPSAPKDRRGCYKRRRSCETWVSESSTLVDDGHAWRKYGQKVILNAKHPRNYYRCTHKYEQKCQATKQVQKIKDDPPIYKTTYLGQHTCKNLVKPPQVINIDSTAADSSIIWSFASRAPEPADYNKPRNKDPLVPAFSNAIKQENQSSSSDYFIPSDPLTAFDQLSSGGSENNHGDVISNSGVYSCTASTHSMDMDMITGSVDFGDFELDFP